MSSNICQKESWNGRCCCNCTHQVEIVSHPWNNNEFSKGRISNVIGYGCKAMMIDTPEEQCRKLIFFENIHGMCEEHEFKYA